jgi:hypothetical protein
MSRFTIFFFYYNYLKHIQILSRSSEWRMAERRPDLHLGDEIYSAPLPVPQNLQ